MDITFVSSKKQTDIARAAGVTRQTVRNWIAGKGCMTVDHAIKIAEVYCVSVQEVIGGNDGVRKEIESVKKENRRRFAR